jgi:hypothetical protein
LNPILVYEVYLVGLAFSSLILSELFFAYWSGRDYLRIRAELEYLIRRIRELELEGKRRRRVVASLAARINVLRTSMKRLLFVRLLSLLLMYTVIAIIALLRFSLSFLPLSCCIPLFTLEVNGVCVVSSAILLAFSFLAALPLVQEDIILITLYKRSSLGRDKTIKA